MTGLDGSMMNWAQCVLMNLRVSEFNIYNNQGQTQGGPRAPTTLRIKREKKIWASWPKEKKRKFFYWLYIYYTVALPSSKNLDPLPFN